MTVAGKGRDDRRKVGMTHRALTVMEATGLLMVHNITWSQIEPGHAYVHMSGWVEQTQFWTGINWSVTEIYPEQIGSKQEPGQELDKSGHKTEITIEHKQINWKISSICPNSWCKDTDQDGSVSHLINYSKLSSSCATVAKSAGE